MCIYIIACDILQNFASWQGEVSRMQKTVYTQVILNAEEDQSEGENGIVKDCEQFIRFL